MNREKGFTLVELLIVVALMGIMISLASLGFDVLHRQRLSSAAVELLADLQTVRMNALTKRSNPASRGFGLRFLDDSYNAYRTFEFIDDGAGTPADADNYEYNDGEEVVDFEKELGAGVEVKIGASGDDPFGREKALLYDKRGMVRNSTWSSVAGRTYVLTHPNVANAKCVTVSRVRIRGGSWNGTSCDIQ